MTRAEVIRVAAIGIGAVLVAVFLGFASWGPWAQLATVVVASLLASAGAPHAFGWREPRR
jgi:membrane protein implicated in regulation of membrane protease activity